ncbi:tetratricopeptide repeat family protein [Lyngbya aestuarii BL J]|uniref:protein O-GlcNAc transferase n=1 Tax=Lyngbya aestuarii BL J TaxID=1348334 RepID=U7QPG2_9CYAN|nr:tetratricopeptide repeat protein [Lyngbya aestuarii]ERT09869.1 tetratricopeptide repeat family protein [Lyngbya aestuarii BL J]
MLDRLYTEANAFSDAGYWSEAEDKYQQILALENTHTDAWRELGMIYYCQERYPEALDAFYSALELDSSTAIQYYYLGLGLAATEDFTAAISAYEQAIFLDLNWSDAYHQLGRVYLELGEFEQAETYYIKAIDLNSNNSDFYLDLGNILIAKQQIGDAIIIYKKALKLDSQNPHILYQLGIAFTAIKNSSQAAFYFGDSAYYQAQYTEAIQSYQESLKVQTQDIDVYLKLADCYQKIEQYPQAIHTYQQAVEQRSDSTEGLIEIYLAWINLLQEIGETEAAINIAKNALETFPNDFSLKLTYQRILPILYNNTSEIEQYRQRFSDLLTQLITETDLTSPNNSERLLAAISTHTNFYLQYQGYNDLELQKQYGKFLHQIIKTSFPQWIKPINRRSYQPNDKIKIGYISSFFQWHTVGIVFLGWLKKCNFQDFELYCYYTVNEADELTDLYRYYSDYFYEFQENLIDIAETIYADKLDILVFLDLGMCPLTTQIASLRLASIQCAAWGHPVTTGLPTIDYFISPDLLEPQNAQTHYSETLIRLPNLGIYYEKPEIPELEKTRSNFGLKNDTVIYLSCQSLFKYLPQYDKILVEIAKQVPLAEFVFVSHWNSVITEKFRQRLKRAFADFSLNSEDYCTILPRLEKSDYLQLNLIADIGLDTIQFTGFLTTLDSIACNLPIVTCEGELMRSRQTAGILKRIGVTETIVQNEKEYIKIAVKLGLNRFFREEVCHKIQQNKSVLYEDKNGIQGLENFYKQVITV